MSAFIEVPWDQLTPPPEPLRATMTDEGMDDLVESIKVVGVLFPLIVTFTKDKEVDYTGLSFAELIKLHVSAMCKFEIIDGHRRWMACQRAGVRSVWVNVFGDVEEAKHAMMLHANIFREDVTPAEEGWQFLELANKYQWSLDKLMRTFKVSENYINDRVELVSKDKDIAQAVHEREINLGQAHELLREKDPERRRTRLLLTKEHGYNVRELRVMRQNLEKERQGAQQELMPHTPQYATTPQADAPKCCVWCGSAEDQDNMRTIPIHWYHEREVRAVCDQVGIKNLIAGDTKK